MEQKPILSNAFFQTSSRTLSLQSVDKIEKREQININKQIKIIEVIKTISTFFNKSSIPFLLKWNQ
jgi:hypothetical protein